jgi:hypothetical protein
MGSSGQDLPPEPEPAPTPILTPQQQLEMRIRAAERAHDVSNEFARGANQAAISSGQEAIKALVLINGGSCVAMLAFIGTLASKSLLTSAQITQVIRPLFFFGGGIAAAMVAAGAAYLTNLMIAGSVSRRNFNYDHPFVHPTPASRRHYYAGEVFRYVALLSAFCAIAGFIWGLFQVQRAFQIFAAPSF